MKRGRVSDLKGDSVAIIDSNEGWITAKTGKKYRLLERNGRMVREYESGILLDDKTLKIVKPADSTLLTRYKASELVKNRWEQAEKAAIEGMVRAFDGRAANGDEAWGMMIEATARKGIKDEGQAGNRAVEIVGRATGYLRSKTEVVPVGGNGSSAEHLSPEAWQLLDRVIKRMGEILDRETQNDPIITTDKGTNHELSDGRVVSGRPGDEVIDV